MKISVVIPAWNEEGNVSILAKRFHKFFKLNGIDYELIFVLRGNPKESGYDELNNLPQEIKVKPILLHKIKGYANSSKFGFNFAASDSDYIVTCDADLNHAPEDLKNFLKCDEDIIIGSRYLEDSEKSKVGPAWKRFLSRLMNKTLGIMFGLKVKDKTSGYRMYKKHVIDDIHKKTEMKGFEFLPELLMIAKSEGYNMREVPITFSPRLNGVSKMDIKKTIIGYLKLFIGGLRL